MALRTHVLRKWGKNREKKQARRLARARGNENMRGREKKMLAAASVGLVDILGLPTRAHPDSDRGSKEEEEEEEEEVLWISFFLPAAESSNSKAFFG